MVRRRPGRGESDAQEQIRKEVQTSAMFHPYHPTRPFLSLLLYIFPFFLLVLKCIVRQRVCLRRIK